MDLKQVVVRLEYTLTATLIWQSMFVGRITATLRDGGLSCQQIKAVLILSKLVLNLSLIVKVIKKTKIFKMFSKD